MRVSCCRCIRGRLRGMSTMVNQKDFNKASTAKKVTRLRRLLHLAVETSYVSIQVRIHRRLRYALTGLKLLIQRSKEVVCATFNLNAYSDAQCLGEFRCTRDEIPVIMNHMNWTAGVTSHNGYVVDTVTATCILLRSLSYPCRWTDLEIQFGHHASALSEVFIRTLRRT